MNRLKHYLPSPMELLFVAAIGAAIWFVLYPAVQAARNPNGPHGAMIPEELPDERNRVTHASGVSIVAPPNWDDASRHSEVFSFLRIVARGSPLSRWKSLIIIQETDAPASAVLDKCQSFKFRGWPAYEKMQIDRAYTGDDPGSSTYDLYVNQDGRWWLIGFTVADEMTELPPEIRRYLDTIRFPDDGDALPRRERQG